MNIEQFKGLARLPKFAIPSHYDLHLKLDLSAACTFYGTVKINLSITEKTNFLVLNANQLHVHQALLTTSGNQQYFPSDVVVDDDDEVVVLVFDETLCVGEGLLRIEFSGKLNEHLKGLYRCTYVDEGVKKNMAVTQFEAADARRCFPCWDEPALKSQFLSSGLHDDGEWTVPITLALRSYDKRKNFLLESKFGTVDISEFFPSSDETLWIKVNVEQSGFYRVMYEDRLAAPLRKAVENNCLLATDKFGILDDMFALCEACEQPLSSLLLLMNAYRNEMDNMVLLKLIDVRMPSKTRLGIHTWRESFRCNVKGRSVHSFGHDKTRREAMQRFQVLLNDKNTPLLSADMRKAAYISVMRNSSTTNRNGFEALLKFYREVDAMQEKERILQSLASSPDPDIVLEVLNFLLSDEVRDQDIIYRLVGLSLECRKTAWRWLKENWNRIVKKYSSGMLLHYFVREIVTPLSSNEKAEEVEAFFGSHVNPAVDKILKQSIERIRIKRGRVESSRVESSLAETPGADRNRSIEELTWCCGDFMNPDIPDTSLLTGDVSRHIITIR
ncbi:hypothetical protein LWI29_010334 [Acer saccharum]|uniref:Aminopeptidase n=1 Tax=Acer saccharum TaxID=4024 RepID=A0AA39SKQ0_ACESA|nr:hypothetical protein LWI29_010334 [Acer saccharum]